MHAVARAQTIRKGRSWVGPGFTLGSFWVRPGFILGGSWVGPGPENGRKQANSSLREAARKNLAARSAPATRGWNIASEHAPHGCHMKRSLPRTNNRFAGQCAVRACRGGANSSSAQARVALRRHKLLLRQLHGQQVQLAFQVAEKNIGPCAAGPMRIEGGRGAVRRAQQGGGRLQIVDLFVDRLQPGGRAAAVAPNAVQLHDQAQHQGDLPCKNDRAPKVQSSRLPE